LTRLLPQPDRDTIPEDQLEYFDAIVERERNRGLLDENGRVTGYFGVLSNSPAMGSHISGLGRLVRMAGDSPGTYSHADREWVDMVLSSDWKTNAVLEPHIPDALAQGVRLDAIIALREGREEELNEDETLLTAYVRAVRDGAVTDELFAQMKDRLGARGIADYTIFIMFLVLTIRLIEAFTGTTGPTDAEIKQLLSDYKDGTKPIPDKPMVGAG
jgi:hypothetical protein